MRDTNNGKGPVLSTSDRTSDRESIFRLSPGLLFSILTAISLAIWWRALTSSFALALRDDQYTHILLILPVSAALIFMDWKSPEPFTGLNLSIGSGLLAAAVVAIVLARLEAVALQPDEQLSMNMLALVVWWVGAFVLCFGTRAFRRALFPLCFLFWMVPIPQFVLNPIVGLL
jgi:hypothetical protein